MNEAAAMAQASPLKRFFEAHRTLDKYPTGAYQDHWRTGMVACR
jgi:hypothetical protein